MEVRIRAWDEGDAEALVEAITASLRELLPWMPWARDEPLTVEQRRAWIREMRASEAAGGSRARAVIADGRVAGALGLHARIGPGAIEIGYWIRTSMTGHGLATIAVGLAATEAFADPTIDHLEIHYDLRNPRSGAVASRAGFTHLRDQPDPDGTHTERIWRLQRASWEERQG